MPVSLTNIDSVHLYEIELKLIQPNGDDDLFTTTFVAQHTDKPTADKEALFAAYRCGKRVELELESIGGSVASNRVHVRRHAAFRLDGDGQTHNDPYAMVGIVNLAGPAPERPLPPVRCPHVNSRWADTDRCGEIDCENYISRANPMPIGAISKGIKTIGAAR